MWRTNEEREDSARARLELAKEVWDWEPHPRQRDFFCSTAQIRIAACGRRWGKTECLSVDAATLALAELRGGRACQQLVVAPSEAQARLLGEEIRRRLQEALDGGRPIAEGVTMAVRRKAGLALTLTRPGNVVPYEASVICRTAGVDGAGLRGLWAHRIIVDEAARVPDAVLSGVLMPMLADVGGEYVLASSPSGRRALFYQLWTRGMVRDPSAAGGDVTYESFQCPSWDNPRLNAAFLDEQREGMGEAAFAEEFEAEFADDGGAVFPSEDIDAAVEGDPRVQARNGALLSAPVAGRLYAAGIDWARKKDYSVLCILDATDLPARLVYLQRWRGTTWGVQMQTIAEALLEFRPLRVLADGNAMGDAVGEMLQTRIGQVCPPADRPPTVEQFIALMRPHCLRWGDRTPLQAPGYQLLLY